MKTARVLSFVFLASAIAGGQAQTIDGQFALQGQKAQTEGRLKVTPVLGKPLSERLDFWMQEPGKSRPIRDYQVDWNQKGLVHFSSSPAIQCSLLLRWRGTSGKKERQQPRRNASPFAHFGASK